MAQRVNHLVDTLALADILILLHRKRFLNTKQRPWLGRKSPSGLSCILGITLDDCRGAGERNAGMIVATSSPFSVDFNTSLILGTPKHASAPHPGITSFAHPPQGSDRKRHFSLDHAPNTNNTRLARSNKSTSSRLMTSCIMSICTGSVGKSDILLKHSQRAIALPHLSYSFQIRFSQGALDGTGVALVQVI